MRKTWRRGDFFVSVQADKEVPRFFCLLIGLGQAGPRNFSHRAVRFGYLTTEQLLSGDGAKRSGN